MANNQTAYGLRLVGHVSGGHPQTLDLRIPSAYNTSIFCGDPVKPDAGGSGYIVPASAGDAILGIFVGCEYINKADGNYNFKSYFPANTTTQGSVDVRALVIVDPDALFKIKSPTARTQADMFATCNFNAGGGGSTTTGLSSVYLDSTQSTNLGFVMLNLSPEQDNSFGTYQDILVIPSLHLLRGQSGWVA